MHHLVQPPLPTDGFADDTSRSVRALAAKPAALAELRVRLALLALGVALVFIAAFPGRSYANVPIPPQYDCSVSNNGGTIVPSCSMPPADSASCTGNAFASDCFIWEPNVKNDKSQAPLFGLETYNVRFAPGDQAFLYANGCAQGGGSGQTWHRYVSPNDNLHWGAASIRDDSGAYELNKLQFSSIQAVAEDIRAPGSLQLYYNDDPGAYGDNGYWGWDGGDVNECQRSGWQQTSSPNYGGPAWVYVHIVHDTSSPSVIAVAPAPNATYNIGSAVNASYSCSPSVSWVTITNCSGPDAVGTRIDTSSVGTKSFTITANDSAGRASSQVVYYSVVDPAAPAISVSAPADGAGYDQGQVVDVNYSCAPQQAGGSPITSCVGNVPSGGQLDTSTYGRHTFTVTAANQAGNHSTRTLNYSVLDVSAPSVSAAVPVEGATYGRGQTVAANFACADEPGGSGLASCHGTVDNGQPIDTSTLGAKTLTISATDNAGNQTTKVIHYTVVDVTPPGVTIDSPASNAVFYVGQVVPAAYSCQDDAGGSGLASCSGGIGTGAPLDTSTPGKKQLTVVAVDGAGNRTSQSVDYFVVGYPVVTSSVTLYVKDRANGAVRITVLTADDVAAGTTITPSCRGGGCPHGLRRIQVEAYRTHIHIAPLQGAQLRPGAVLRLGITQPNAIGRLFVWRVQRNGYVVLTKLCVAPGKAAGPCST
jgi:hypothetical protein